MEEVKLYGFWCSPFSHRVIWALKHKGISYEYIDEDLENKSEQLLKYNPVYKKIPVLVHRGKPISESLIILEYIEETWPQNPLLPADPHQRATARFWMKYLDHVGPAFHAHFREKGEAQEKAAEAGLQMLKILEDQALGDNKVFGGGDINLVDIAYGFMSYWFDLMQQIMGGSNLLDPVSFPRLHAWAMNFKGLPLIKENTPDQAKMIEHLNHLRNKFVQEADT